MSCLVCVFVQEKSYLYHPGTAKCYTKLKTKKLLHLHCRILGSNEVLSTDEEDTDEEDSDFDELGKNLENMLSNKKTSHQVLATCTRG